MEVATWAQVKKTYGKDSSITLMVEMIRAGLPEEGEHRPSQTKVFFWARETFLTKGPVIMFKDSIIIPISLQPVILDHLHPHRSQSHPFHSSRSAVIISHTMRRSSSSWWTGQGRLLIYSVTQWEGAEM